MFFAVFKEDYFWFFFNSVRIFNFLTPFDTTSKPSSEYLADWMKPFFYRFEKPPIFNAKPFFIFYFFFFPSLLYQSKPPDIFQLISTGGRFTGNFSVFFFKSYSSGFVFWSSSYSSSSSSSYSSSSSSLQQQSVPSCGYFTPHFDYCTSDGYYPVFWVLYRPLSTVVHHVMAMINLIKNLFYRK